MAGEIAPKESIMAVMYGHLEVKPKLCCGKNPVMRREYSAEKKEKRLYCANCGRLARKATSLSAAVRRWNEKINAERRMNV
jgi:hypothetical protein